MRFAVFMAGKHSEILHISLISIDWSSFVSRTVPASIISAWWMQRQSQGWKFILYRHGFSPEKTSL